MMHGTILDRNLKTNIRKVIAVLNNLSNTPSRLMKVWMSREEWPLLGSYAVWLL
jgi:hypothetical protein